MSFYINVKQNYNDIIQCIFMFVIIFNWNNMEFMDFQGGIEPSCHLRFHGVCWFWQPPPPPLHLENSGYSMSTVFMVKHNQGCINEIQQTFVYFYTWNCSWPLWYNFSFSFRFSKCLRSMLPTTKGNVGRRLQPRGGATGARWGGQMYDNDRKGVHKLQI